MAEILQALSLPPPISAGILPFRQQTVNFTANRRCYSGYVLSASTQISHSGRISFICRSVGVNGGSDQENDGETYQTDDANPSNFVSWKRTLLEFGLTNFLPIALVSGVALGLANPTLGCLAHKYSLSKFSTFGIFIISGLTLRSKEIGAAIEAWPAGIFGLGSILFITPILSRLILKVQLAPPEFIIGLAIFCCMPTTLSSGVALTNLVGGNSALALAITVVSNLLGIIIVPFSLSRFIGAGAGVSIPTTELLKSLVSTLLVPLILGKVLRESFNGVADYVDQNRRLFSMMNSAVLSLVCLILTTDLVRNLFDSNISQFGDQVNVYQVPWIQVSRSRPLFFRVAPFAFVIAISTGILLHLVLLGFNTLAVKMMSSFSKGKESVFSKKENSRAVIIVSSQKTLPVMVAVVDQLSGAFGEPGLLVLPCVAAHINQIIIDSILVNFWIKQDQTKPKET